MNEYFVKNELIKHSSLNELVAVYRKAMDEIRAGFKLIHDAEKMLETGFVDSSSYTFNVNYCSPNQRVEFDDPDRTISAMKCRAWRVLIERMALRRVLTKARTDELERQLETGDGLPEITEANILAMMDTTLSNVTKYIEEAVKETYDRLRPRNNQYKTNDEFKVGRRVILGYAVEQRYNSSAFSPQYQSEPELRGIDNVFHMLDGKGSVKTYGGPLLDAIKASRDGTGETDYFKFRCCINRNLHLEFKRLDLVDQLNIIAGGGSLKRPPETSTQTEPEKPEPFLLETENSP